MRWPTNIFEFADFLTFEQKIQGIKATFLNSLNFEFNMLEVANIC